MPPRKKSTLFQVANIAFDHLHDAVLNRPARNIDDYETIDESSDFPLTETSTYEPTTTSPKYVATVPSTSSNSVLSIVQTVGSVAGAVVAARAIERITNKVISTTGYPAFFHETTIAVDTSRPPLTTYQPTTTHRTTSQRPKSTKSAGDKPTRASRKPARGRKPKK